MISIVHRSTADLHILDLKGQFRAPAEHTFWLAAQEAIVEQGVRRLILNFSEVTQIDSYGISELLKVYNALTNMDGQIILVGLNDLVAKVFRITKVEDLMQVVETEAEAIALLQPQVSTTSA